MKKLLVAGLLLSLSSLASAANQWTGWGKLDMIFTYTTSDTLSVHLDNFNCPNTKDFFSIIPGYTDNARQQVSMLLMAKANNSTVNLRFEDSYDAGRCYITGIQVQ